jgi:hypothetical protein
MENDARSKTMQKWEYSFVFATVTNDGEFRPPFANEEELDDWQAGPTLYEYANQLRQCKLRLSSRQDCGLKSGIRC